MSAVQRVVGRLDADRETLALVGLLVNTQLVFVLLYPTTPDLTPDGWRNVAYAFVWVNVAALAAWKTTPPPASARQRAGAAAVAAAYFAVLAVAGGLVGLGVGFGSVDVPATGFRVAWLVPGWGPAPTYGGEVVRFALQPYKVVGYLGLAYLVYATVLDAAGAAVSGALGLLSCVSCTWPALLTVATGVLGSSSGVAAAVQQWSYELSTVVFVVTVALLYWRPGR